MKLIELPSVGSYLDPEYRMVYPGFADGSVDMDNPTPLEDVDEEWRDALSAHDLRVFLVAKVAPATAPEVTR